MRLLFSMGFNKICAVEAMSITLEPVIENPRDLYYVTVRDFNGNKYTAYSSIGCRFEKDEANLIVKKLYETGRYLVGENKV